MASPAKKADAVSGLSFAKVAASPARENVTMSYAKMAATNLAQNAKPAVAGSPDKAAAEDQKNKNKKTNDPDPSDSKLEVTAEDCLSESMRKVSLTTPIVNGSGTSLDSNTVFRNRSSEDLYQRTDSGSDLGTKPPSLDGKSITSGTTFALDEKESLRPDDSASVKAAEDDDTFSGRGSIVAGSRIGSEAAARAYRSQVYETSERKIMLPALESQPQGLITPQSGSTGPLIAGNLAQKPLNRALTSEDRFNVFYKSLPDDKLMEAMESPKDRIFLLRLEQQVITFVKDTKEPYFDVPPSNSFCRMLTHKLADYYHLTHQVDGMAGSIRIFRTPFCRLPESLSVVSAPPTADNTPPNVPAMKILRRGGDASSGPSKPTSDDGSEGKDKEKSTKNMTREEKEAHYHAARERIFGNADKSGDITPDPEEGNDVSRSSSVSGKNKSNKPRRRPRNDSDSFDVRSAYTPVFSDPQQQFSQWQQPVMAQYGQVANYGQKVYTPPGTYMPQMIQGNPGAYMSPQPFQAQGYAPYGAAQPQMGAYGSPSGQMSGPWMQPPYQQSPPIQPQQYQQQRTPVQGTTIPYAYGQLPATHNPADPKSQHPIPGSFNRHAFNPKTQSFVPGGGSPMMQQGSPSNHTSPQRYAGYSQSPQQQQYSGPTSGAPGMGTQMGGFGIQMSRQSSNTSVPSSYHASPHMGMARPMQPQPVMMGQPQMQVPMQMQQGVMMMPMQQQGEMQQMGVRMPMQPGGQPFGLGFQGPNNNRQK